MVIDAFVNKKIPLANCSYSQYYERKSNEEPNLFWLEHLDEFEKCSEEIKKESDNRFNIIIDTKKGQKPKNISLKRAKEFFEKIKQGRINNIKDATEWYLKKYLPR